MEWVLSALASVGLPALAKAISTLNYVLVDVQGTGFPTAHYNGGPNEHDTYHWEPLNGNVDIRKNNTGSKRYEGNGNNIAFVWQDGEGSMHLKNFAAVVVMSKNGNGKLYLENPQVAAIHRWDGNGDIQVWNQSGSTRIKVLNKNGNSSLLYFGSVEIGEWLNGQRVPMTGPLVYTR